MKKKPSSQEKTPTKMSLQQLKTEPLFKFLLIGIAIYLAYAFYGRRDGETLVKDNTVTISAMDIGQMETGWQQRYNRAPSEEELDKLIAVRSRELILAAEAKKMGLDKEDVVLTRRVVLQYRNLLEGLIQPKVPTDEILNAYFQEHIEAYRPAAKVSMTHLFFDPDKREETTLDDADKALKLLQNMEGVPTNLEAYGDRFFLANVFTNVSPLELRKNFGREFTKSVLALEPKQWVGPVLSGYGTHLVYVSEKQQGELPALEMVKEQVLADYYEEEKEELIASILKEVKSKYTIVIEPSAVVAN